jgi:hypothetical protein
MDDQVNETPPHEARAAAAVDLPAGLLCVRKRSKELPAKASSSSELLPRPIRERLQRMSDETYFQHILDAANWTAHRLKQSQRPELKHI